MARSAQSVTKIDVLVESERWKEPGKVKSILRRAVREASATLPTRGGELAIILTDDSSIRLLNRQWRGVDKSTNVLSFPAKDPCGQPPLIGDIVLAYETIAREADDEGKPFAHHLAHLTVHGFLHLHGYDHQQDNDAETMEAMERKVLRRLAIPDPYRSHVGTAKKSAKARKVALTRHAESSQTDGTRPDTQRIHRR
jgi:probable rRNA maturation factor